MAGGPAKIDEVPFLTRLRRAAVNALLFSPLFLHDGRGRGLFEGWLWMTGAFGVAIPLSYGLDLLLKPYRERRRVRELAREARAAGMLKWYEGR